MTQYNPKSLNAEENKDNMELIDSIIEKANKIPYRSRI